jgi:hypothetical protein
VLDGTREGPINSLAVLTETAPGYGDGERALLSISVLSDAHDEAALVEACRAQLTGWFYDDRWTHLATYRIPRSLPRQTPDLVPPVHKSVSLGDGLYVGGDHRDTASINGAMLSARRVAEAMGEA